MIHLNLSRSLSLLLPNGEDRLNSETYCGREGSVFFGDGVNGYVLSYMFTVFDAQSRGHRVKYTIMTMMTDRVYLVASMEYLIRYDTIIDRGTDQGGAIEPKPLPPPFSLSFGPKRMLLYDAVSSWRFCFLTFSFSLLSLAVYYVVTIPYHNLVSFRSSPPISSPWPMLSVPKSSRQHLDPCHTPHQVVVEPSCPRVSLFSPFSIAF